VSRLPEVGARVGVKVHEWNAHLASTLEELGAGVVAIALPSDSRADYDLPKGIALDLEWVTPRGLMRVRGHSAGPRSWGSPAIMVELAGDPQVFQRRDYVRASTVVDVVASRNGSFADAVKGCTIDVSGGGLQATLPELRADVDDRLAVEIVLPEEEPIRAEARVIRKAADDTFSVVFEQIEPKEQERLIRFVFQKLRAAAGKAA
jgi:hypothetical protein